MLCLLTLGAALAGPAMPDPDGDRELLPGRHEGPEDIAATWDKEDGWRVSPERSWVTGGSRFGALVDADPDAELTLEVRGLSGGVAGPWIPARETWRGETLRVIVADLGAHYASAQARIAGTEGLTDLAWEIREPVWEERLPDGVVPPPSSALSSTLVALGVISRDDWGADETTCSSTEDEWYRTAIHHTAGSQTYGGTVQGSVQALQAYAMSSGEYCDIPYQFLVGYDGTLWEGRELTYTSGATGGGNNDGNIAICFLGCYHPTDCGDTPDEATDAMIAWARLLLETLAAEHGYTVDEDTVRGHRDWPGNSTACPGEYVYDRLDEIRSSTAPYEAALASQSFPVYGVDAPLTLEVGQSFTGSFTFTNTGTESWTAGGTYLAPIPRDTASSLADASWPSSTRAATLSADVAPGSTGSFSFTVTGVAEGETVQSFGLVQEWITWFADAPYGGGPADGSVSLHVRVVPASVASEGEGEGEGEGELSDTSGGLAGEGYGMPGALLPMEEKGGCACASGVSRAGRSDLTGLLMMTGLVISRRRQRR